MSRIATNIIIFLLTLNCYAEEVTTNNLVSQDFTIDCTPPVEFEERFSSYWIVTGKQYSYICCDS